jgi:ribosomal protein S16
MERARYWISVGAQPSKTAHRLLAKASLFFLFNELTSKLTFE